MFAEYVQEREGGVLFRQQHGFAIYKDFGPDYGYLQDIYVRREFRKQKLATQLLMDVLDFAKKSNKKALLATTDTSTNGATESVLAILHSGFRVLKTEGTVIWYILEI